jgi:hypothetical protein
MSCSILFEEITFASTQVWMREDGEEPVPPEVPPGTSDLEPVFWPGCWDSEMIWEGTWWELGEWDKGEPKGVRGVRGVEGVEDAEELMFIGTGEPGKEKGTGCKEG